MQESPVANKIKEAFFSDRGLAGNVSRLPFERLFAIDSVKKVRSHCCTRVCCYATFGHCLLLTLHYCLLPLPPPPVPPPRHLFLAHVHRSRAPRTATSRTLFRLNAACS